MEDMVHGDGGRGRTELAGRDQTLRVPVKSY